MMAMLDLILYTLLPIVIIVLVIVYMVGFSKNAFLLYSALAVTVYIANSGLNISYMIIPLLLVGVSLWNVFVRGD